MMTKSKKSKNARRRRVTFASHGRLGTAVGRESVNPHNMLYILCRNYGIPALSDCSARITRFEFYINLGMTGTECGGKLYCPPYLGREALVIDPVAGTTSKIPLSRTCGHGDQKWTGAALCGGRLYFNPEYEADVLVITPPVAATD